MNPKVIKSFHGTGLHDDFYLPAAHSGDSSVVLKNPGELVAQVTAGEGGTSFGGGLYWASLQPTCDKGKGNALGAPCAGPNYEDRDERGLHVWGTCHGGDGEADLWCYTTRDYSRWGYCDCPPSWTRHFAG